MKYNAFADAVTVATTDLGFLSSTRLRVLLDLEGSNASPKAVLLLLVAVRDPFKRGVEVVEQEVTGGRANAGVVDG